MCFHLRWGSQRQPSLRKCNLSKTRSHGYLGGEDRGMSAGRCLRRKYVRCVQKHQGAPCGWGRGKEGRGHVGQEEIKGTRPAHTETRACFATPSASQEMPASESPFTVFPCWRQLCVFQLFRRSLTPLRRASCIFGVVLCHA